MKKIMMLAAVFLAAQKMNAQNLITVAPEAGVYQSDMQYTNNNSQPQSNDTKILPRVGAVINFPVHEKYFIQTGLFYHQSETTLTGTSISPGQNNVFTQDITINYLELPLSAGYRHDFSNKGFLFGTFGGYIGCALSGTSDGEYSLNGAGYVPSNETLRFGKSKTGGEQYNYRRVALGLNASVGYQMPVGLYARLQYGYDIRNISNDQLNSVRNRGVSLSLGYAFKLKKKKVAVAVPAEKK